MKNKNFLKKLTAGILGFVMTLGVGAAGYSATASETRAEEATSTLNFTAACSGSGTADDGVSWTITSDAAESNYDSSKGVHYGTNSKAISYLTATSASFDKTITKVVVNCSDASKAASISVTVGGNTFGTSQTESSNNNATYTFTPTIAQGSSFTGVVVVNMSKTSAKKAMYLKQIAVTYEKSGTVKTLESVVVSGTPDKTSYYVGNSFDPKGLIATANYSDGSSEAVTDQVSWSVTPEKLASTTTSVSVVATYKDVNSTAFNVTGLTVESLPGEPTDYTKLDMTSGSNCSDGKFYNSLTEDEVPGIKGGTNKNKTFDVSVTVPKGANKLVLFAAAWNGESCSVTVPSSYCSDNEQSLTSDSGMAGGGPGYNFEASSLYMNQFRHDFDLTGINSDTELTLSFAGRGGIWYVGYKLGNVKTLKSIAVTNQPTKVDYNVGESFSTAGMVVKATYGNSQGADTTETITNYTYSPDGALTSSVSQITITYTENSVTKTATVNIDVTSFKKLEYINNTKEDFKAGDTFDYDGTLREVYAHSSKADTYVDVTSGYKFYIGDNEVTKSTVLEYGLYDVVVKYNNHSTDSYPIIVDYADPTGISMPSTYELGPGNSVNLSSLTTVLPEGYAEKDITWFIDVTEGGLTTDNYSFIEETGTVSIVSDNKVSGKLTVTAVCTNDDNISAECVITVLADTAPVVIAVGVTGTSTAGTQYVHKPLDMSGLTIVGYRDKEGNIEIPTDSLAVTYNPLVVNEHPTGKYTDPVTGNEFSFTVTQILPVEDSLASIAFANSAALTKTSYIVGEDWDSAGLSIVGEMASGDPAASSMLTGVSYTFNPEKPTAGTKSVEVTASLSGVADVKQSFTVSVAAVQLESIEYISGPTKSEYILGETFNPEGLVIKGHYNLSSEDGDLDPSEYTLSEPDMYSLSPAGGTVVTVTSKENALKTCQFTITVNKQTVIPGGTSWNLVNDTSKLKAGDIYTFGCAEKGQVATAMGDDKFFHNGTATFSNGVLTSGENVTPVELTLGGTSGAWTLNDGVGNVSSNAAKALDHSSTATWTISFSDNSVNATIGSFGKIYYNSSNPRFLNYTSSQTAVELYHKVTTQGSSAELIRLESADCNRTGIIPVGTTLEKSDFTVTGLYNDATTKTLATTDFEASGLTLNNVGDNVVTISATGLGSISVHVTAVQATKYDFKLMNGSSQHGETVKAIEGQTIELPTLTEDGKTFNGWSDGTTTYTSSYTMPAHDVTLNADWTTNYYTVTYNINGATGTTPTDSKSGTYVYNDDVTVLSAEGLSKQYCTFGGWSDGKNTYEAGATFKITENVTLTAVWSNNQVKVTYDRNGSGGTAPQSSTFNQGLSYTVKDASESMLKDENRPFGTHFDSWNTAKDGSGTKYVKDDVISTVLENITLYAQWKVDDIPVGGGDASIDLTKMDLDNSEDVTEYNFLDSDEKVSLTFDGNGKTNVPKYYTSGSAVRIYTGNSFTVSTNTEVHNSNIVKIEIIFSGSYTAALGADCGTYVDSTGIWTGSAQEITFTVTANEGQRRIQGITVTFAGGREIPDDATVVENLAGVGTNNPIVLNDGTTVEGLTHERGVLFEGETVSFTASHGKVITYASVYLLYDMGYDLEYSNDYGATWTYNPFAKVTRATRAGESEIEDLKDTNAVRFTLNDPESEGEKDILKSFKVTTSFGTNSEMSVSYDWTKNGNTYTIDITKAYARFAIDVDESFEKYFNEKDQYGGDYWIGFAYSTTGGHVIVNDQLADSGVSYAAYNKDYMPANNEFGLKLNCSSDLTQAKTVALIVKDSHDNLVEFSKEKTASFADVFYAYFTEEVVDNLNAQERAVYETLLQMLSK